MNCNGKPTIVMVGAGGASFGPVMSLEAVKARGLAGSTLVLADISAERLAVVRAAAERINRESGSPLVIETCTDTEKSLEGADYVMLSVEVGRWKYWKQDLEVPQKYGSMQDMAECGGPGGLFHSLRTIPLVLSICRMMERQCPDALLINVTNPLPRVNTAITQATGLRCVGMCPEFILGVIRLAPKLGLRPSGLKARAWGLNHFSWFFELTDARTGKDLYPRLEKLVDAAPFLHEKLVRKCYRDFGYYPVSSDSHIGEYLPSDGPGSRSVLPQWFPYQLFSETECKLRVLAAKLYGSGKIDLPLDSIPSNIEGGMDIVESLVTGKPGYYPAVNVLNDGLFIPNLPEWAIVEVPARAVDGVFSPEHVGAVPEVLADIMRVQFEIARLTAQSVISRDPAPAFDAFAMDPLAPPTRDGCRRAFDELCELQKDVLPF